MIHKLEITNWSGPEDEERASGGYCWCGWRVEDYPKLLEAFNDHLDYSRSTSNASVVINNETADTLARTKAKMEEIERCQSVNPNGGTATCSKKAGHDGEHMNRGGVW